jgi:hypothetical protein
MPTSAKIKGIPRPKSKKPRAEQQVFRLSENATDTVTAQMLASPMKKVDGLYPGKRFELPESGIVDKPKFNSGKFFKTRAYGVDDITSLHAAFERIRTGADVRGEPSYVVTGKLGRWASPEYACRSKRAEQDGDVFRPAGLVDCDHQWLVLDLDKIKNLLGIDPRDGLSACEAAVGFLISLLPPELQSAQYSWCGFRRSRPVIPGEVGHAFQLDRGRNRGRLPGAEVALTVAL